ncbi:hypothetical protein QCA50_009875 [Cerrena zonata]|uniref:Anthranilate phosphoribosyltransferase n=1 Tax=Cerrena zonata TaxID=2478898 RepID=A0AAW0GA59_9APHY
MASQSKNVLTPYIKSLLLNPPNLSPADLETVLRYMFKGIPSTVQMASFLTALRLRGLDHDPKYIAAAAQVLIEFASKVDPESLHLEGYIDIVGTGGDGQNTFNVSTSSAIVASGMGLRVCKHGGKASTSTSGSGDLLKCLGVDLSSVNSTTTADIVKKTNFCFLFAPSFHPVMGKVASIRAELGIPTIFNILGPLINPMPLRARILGVYSENIGESYAQAVSEMVKSSKHHERTMIVHGKIGLDEISPVGFTKCWIIDKDGDITINYISPKDFDLPDHNIDTVKSGTPEENAKTLLHILRQDHEDFKIKDSGNHPIVDYILLNSAALAVVSGLCTSWVEGVELAKESIRSGAANSELESFKAAILDLPEI